ncbi:MAG: hypothetical protein IIU39_07825 [Ruminococcus sp.]|nr:hypothetical protein [Ruminococcus sp.]
MKRFICVSIALIIAFSAALASCSPIYDKTPDKYSKVRWYAPDYCLRFTTSDGCKGTYKFGDTKYNVQLKFDGSFVTATDTDKKKEIFNGDWSYEENERLYLYNLTFNSKDFKEFEKNYTEFITLNKEKE